MGVFSCLVTISDLLLIRLVAHLLVRCLLVCSRSIFFPNDSCDTTNNDWFIGKPSTDLQKEGLKFEPTSIWCYIPDTCNAFGDDGLCLDPKSPTW